MPKCKNCSADIPWGYALVSNFRRFKEIECENCNAKNYPNSIYKIITTILDSSPILFIGNFPAHILFGLMVLIILISPFFAKYELRKEERENGRYEL